MQNIEIIQTDKKPREDPFDELGKIFAKYFLEEKERERKEILNRNE